MCECTCLCRSVCECVHACVSAYVNACVSACVRKHECIHMHMYIMVLNNAVTSKPY